jgi:hypothetical protein
LKRLGSQQRIWLYNPPGRKFWDKYVQNFFHTAKQIC